jgi:hypothetical protein
MILLALLAIGSAGAGLVEAGLPHRPARGRALRAALAVALGLGTWSAAYAAQWLATGARGTAVKDLVLSAAGAGLFFAGRRWQSAGRSSDCQPPGRSSDCQPAPLWLTVLFCAACALTAVSFVEHTLRFPDGGWDAWMTWNLRARFLVRAAEARDAFSPRMLFWAHQEYPWLVPGVVAQTCLLLGESYAAPAAVAFAFGALTISLLTLFLGRLYGPRAGLLGGLALCGMPCFATFAANQQADVPLALYFLAAAALLQLSREPRTVALAGFAAGLCVWTKSEGAVYAGCLAAGLLLRRRGSFWPFLLGTLPGFALLAAFKLRVAPPSAFIAEGMLRRAFDPHRFGELLLLSLRRIFYFQNFALWVVAWLAAIAVYRRKLIREPLGVALLFAFAACAAIYLVQPYPLGWIFRTSADRLFIELWPAAILLTLPMLLPATART